MELPDALAWLDSHLNREATAGDVGELSLAPIQALSTTLGDPQKSFRSIHITGTNGKGSVARMVSALLAAHGLSVGSYTSPHLARLNERICRNSEEIADSDLAEVLSELEALESSAPGPLEGIELSWFELVTAAAFSWFAASAVDVAVVEVGLLGRFDATNVLDADVAVITSVGRDHTDGAGDWRRSIAWEKAGIVSPDSTVVLGEPDRALREVFEAEVASAVAERMWVREEDYGASAERHALGGRVVDLWTPGGVVEDVTIPLHGSHQTANAATALAAAEGFFDRRLDDEVVREAFEEVRLPGRFEVLGRHPLVVLDAAHNPPGAEAAAETLDGEFELEGRRILVVGMLAGRDPEEMLVALGARRADLLFACDAPSPRRLGAEELGAVASRLGVRCEVVPEIPAAVDTALAVAAEPDVVMVTGSLYVVGAAREHLLG